ncbi:MAG: hypothetical protein M3O25_00225 [Actinomycetota bacterium]|nr:hypothetical protein [Actinomycetota bacterium]
MPARLLISAICLGLLGALALPAGAATKPRGLVASLSSAQCAQERAEIGKRAFRKRYGAKKPIAACAKSKRAEVRRAVDIATAECQAELDAFGLEEFLFEWDSFAGCVASYAELELDGGLDDDPGDAEEDV